MDDRDPNFARFRFFHETGDFQNKNLSMTHNNYISLRFCRNSEASASEYISSVLREEFNIKNSESKPCSNFFARNKCFAILGITLILNPLKTGLDFSVE